MGDLFRIFLSGDSWLGVRGEEGAGASGRRWDVDGVRWERPVKRGRVDRWVGGWVDVGFGRMQGWMSE